MGGTTFRRVLLRLLDLPLDLADRVLVLVQLAAVRRSEAGHQLAAPLRDDVQDAGPLAGPAGPGRRVEGVRVAEEALESQPRVGLRGHGGGGGAPGDAVRVGAAVAGVAVAHRAGLLASQLEGRQPGLRGQGLGHDLVGGDPVPDVRARGLLGVHAGEEAGGGPRVVAGAVPQLVGVVVGEPAQHQQVLAERLQRLQDAGEREGPPSSAGFQSGMMMPFGTYTKDSRTGRRGGRAGQGGRMASSNGQGQGGARAPQERPPREVPAEDGRHEGPPSPFRIWNGRLCAIPITSAENR